MLLVGMSLFVGVGRLVCSSFVQGETRLVSGALGEILFPSSRNVRRVFGVVLWLSRGESMATPEKRCW